MVVINSLQMTDVNHFQSNGDGVPKSLSRKLSDQMREMFIWFRKFLFFFPVVNPSLERMKSGTYLIKVRKKDYKRFYILENDMMSIAYTASEKACSDPSNRKRSKFTMIS